MIESKTPSRSLIHRVLALPRRDLALCCVAAWLVVAFVPFFYEQRYTSRAVAYALVLPFGLLALGRAVSRRERAAWLAVAFLGWASLSSIFADARWLSILPAMNRQENLFTYASVFGLWAMSRTMSSRGVEALGWAFVGAAVFNGLVGVLQVVFGIENGPLSSAFGRATGFSTNPVFFGAVSCGAGVWFAWQLAADSRMRMYVIAPGVAGCAAFVTLSGSRVAVVALILIILSMWIVQRTWRQGFAILFATTGFVVGTLIGSVGSGARATGARLDTNGVSARLHIWTEGLRAFTEQPLLGHGLGRFRPAVQSGFTPKVIRDAGVGDLDGAWFDSHNIGIQLLVGVGAVGTVLFVLFVVTAGRRCRGPLAWAAAAIAITWSLQPSGHVTLGIVALLFGASQARLGAVADPKQEFTEPSSDRRDSIMVVGTWTVSLVLASWLIAADLSLKWAESERTVDASRRVAWLSHHDPVALSQAATFVLNPADPDPDVRSEVLGWSRQATRAEPDFPLWWASLGIRQLIYGDERGARRSFEHALELQPYHEVSLRNLALIAERSGDADRARVLRAQLLELEES